MLRYLFQKSLSKEMETLNSNHKKSQSELTSKLDLLHGNLLESQQKFESSEAKVEKLTQTLTEKQQKLENSERYRTELEIEIQAKVGKELDNYCCE